MAAILCTPVKDKPPKGNRYPRFLRLGMAVLLAELLTFVLLKLGLGVASSLEIVVGLCAVVLTRSWLIRSVRRSWAFSGFFLRLAGQCVKDRRSWQFSLRTLLVAVLVVACLCSWYANRLRKICTERDFLAGPWQVINDDGTPVVLPDGTGIVVRFDDASTTLYSHREPKWVDFHTLGRKQPPRAIYRMEGKRIRVSEAVGKDRPTSFENICDQTVFLLERMPK